MNVIELEQPKGVVVQFAVKQPSTLAEPLSKAEKILGTQVADLTPFEDQHLFEQAS